MLFGNRSIKSRVWDAINKKIKLAQKRYDDELKVVEVDQKKEVEDLERKHFVQQEDLFEKHVGSIIGKII